MVLDCFLIWCVADHNGGWGPLGVQLLGHIMKYVAELNGVMAHLQFLELVHYLPNTSRTRLVAEQGGDWQGDC